MPLPDRETIARAIYRERPCVATCTGAPLHAGARVWTYEWPEAPTWYRAECYALADAVRAVILLGPPASERATGSQAEAA